MRSPTDPVVFAIYIYDSVEPIDLGATFGVLSMARRLLPGIVAHVIAPRAGPVTLAGGLVVTATCALADCPAADVLIVCGGAGWVQQSADPDILALLRRWQAPGRILASVCTGGMILAGAGVLAGKRATTRRFASPAETCAPLALLGAGIEAVPAAVVDEGAIVTGGGVSLAADTTLHLIARFYGETAMLQVARLIEYDRALAANRELAHASPH